MTVSTTTDAPVDLEVDLLLLPFSEAPSDPFVEALSETLGAAVERSMHDFEAEEGQARVIYPEHTTAPRVALLGLGPASDLDADALRTAAGVMTSETDAAAERLYAIQRAGERTGERVHPLPMYEVYREHLESDIADLKNIGGRKAGAITAGKFLEHFVGDSPWLHLDIAGPAFRTTAQTYQPRGGTGFGVRLLVDYLRNYVAPRDHA